MTKDYSIELWSSERFFCPSIFLLNLSFFLRCKIVLDVKVLSDFNHGLILDLGGYLGARKLEKRLNVQVVGSHDKLEEFFLLKVDVICMPLIDNLGHIAVREGLVDFGWLMVE